MGSGADSGMDSLLLLVLLVCYLMMMLPFLHRIRTEPGMHLVFFWEVEAGGSWEGKALEEDETIDLMIRSSVSKTLLNMLTLGHFVRMNR